MPFDAEAACCGSKTTGVHKQGSLSASSAFFTMPASPNMTLGWYVRVSSLKGIAYFFSLMDATGAQFLLSSHRRRGGSRADRGYRPL